MRPVVVVLSALALACFFACGANDARPPPQPRDDEPHGEYEVSSAAPYVPPADPEDAPDSRSKRSKPCVRNDICLYQGTLVCGSPGPDGCVHCVCH